jgi:hypothetical protein
LGYYLEMVDRHPSFSAVLEYRGIDRLPEFPQMDLEVGPTSIPTVWWDYQDAIDSYELRIDLDVALAFQARLTEEVGLVTEVVYAEVSGWPAEAGAASRTTQRSISKLRQRLPDLLELSSAITHLSEGLRERFLGFDLSTPVPPIHSAIANPMLARVQPNPAELLNDSGLFPTLRSAETYLADVNNLGFSGPALCAIGVWALEGAD